MVILWSSVSGIIPFFHWVNSDLLLEKEDKCLQNFLLASLLSQAWRHPVSSPDSLWVYLQCNHLFVYFLHAQVVLNLGCLKGLQGDHTRWGKFPSKCMAVTSFTFFWDKDVWRAVQHRSDRNLCGWVVRRPVWKWSSLVFHSLKYQ